MERRVLLAIFLAFLVLYVWQALFVKPVPKPPAGGQVAKAGAPAAGGSSPGAASASPTSGASLESGTPPATAEANSASPSPALVGQTAERDIRVETREVIAVFTNRGARLKSWRLKRYLNPAREPQELVENSVSTQPLPFTLRTGTDAIDSALNTSLYAVSGAPAAPLDGAPADVRFEYRNSAGVQAVKEFHFEPASFIVTVHATVKNGEQSVTPAIVWGPAVGDVAEVSRYTSKPEGLLFQGGKVARLDTSAIAKQSVYDGEFKYAGVDDNYFI